MRTIVLAALFATMPVCLAAQTRQAEFSFNGHHIGELRSAGAPWARCTEDRKQHKSMCLRARELVEGVRLDVGYAYLNDRLSSVSFRVYSTGFDRLLPALTKRYGKPFRLVRANKRDYAEWRFKEGRLHLTRTGSRANEVVFGTFASGE